MQLATVSPLAAWETFYVIVGSSSAALTGLMFVVVSLGAERRTRATPHVLAAFGTPTVVHFCAAFVVSVIVSTPWHTVANAGVLMGIIGLAGVGYVVVVVRRARRQTLYRPVFEDWLWHAILPLASYAALAASALALQDDRTSALYGIGAATLLLILIGIHNAWDAVTYNVLELQREASNAEAEKPNGTA